MTGLKRKYEAPEPFGDWKHLRARRLPVPLALLVIRLFSGSLDLTRQGIATETGYDVGAAYPRLSVRDSSDFAARLAKDGPLGFGEGFVRGSWRGGMEQESLWEETETVVDWLCIAADAGLGNPSWLSRKLTQLQRLTLPRSMPNEGASAIVNVSHHYDLSADFFALFLDPTLNYSSGNWSTATSLEDAQSAKMDDIYHLANCDNAASILDIGCGWGSFLAHAADKSKADLVGLTLSDSQRTSADRNLRRHRVDRQVDILQRNFQAYKGLHDSIVSIEMLEAIGERNWIGFFKRIEQSLTPAGAVGIQFITYPHKKMAKALDDFSWVDRYIFPGGQLPSIQALEELLGQHTRLEFTVLSRLSTGYAQTLREWRRRLCINADEVRALGFDDNFLRLWALYFAYFEAGFRARHVDVWQARLQHR